MKTLRSFSAAAVVLFALFYARPAAAQAPAATAPAADVDPVGMYDFEASLGIEMRTGTLELVRGAEGQITGEAWLEGEGSPAVVQNGTVTGNHVQLNALVNGSMPVTFVLDFTGNEFSGIIRAGNDEITVDGTRRP